MKAATDSGRTRQWTIATCMFCIPLFCRDRILQRGKRPDDRGPRGHERQSILDHLAFCSGYPHRSSPYRKMEYGDGRWVGNPIGNGLDPVPNPIWVRIRAHVAKNAGPPAVPVGATTDATEPRWPREAPVRFTVARHAELSRTCFPNLLRCSTKITGKLLLYCSIALLLYCSIVPFFFSADMKILQTHMAHLQPDDGDQQSVRPHLRLWMDRYKVTAEPRDATVLRTPKHTGRNCNQRFHQLFDAYLRKKKMGEIKRNPAPTTHVDQGSARLRRPGTAFRRQARVHFEPDQYTPRSRLPGPILGSLTMRGQTLFLRTPFHFLTI
jgi:hypothetical protein